jgi:hypothetical protein
LAWYLANQDHTTKYIDIAYSAVCEDLDDVAVLVRNDGSAYQYDKSSNTWTAKSLDDICPGEHTYVSDANGHKENSCDVCGFKGGASEAHTYNYNKENNSYDCVCGYSVAGKSIDSGVEYVVHPGEFLAHEPHTYDKGIFVDDDGTVYQKFGENNGAQNNYFEIRITKGENLSVPTGRYFVLKMRSDKPDPADDTNYRLYMHNFSGHINAKMSTASIFTGDWVIYIIDLEKAFPSYYVKDTEGNYPAMRYDTIIGGWSRPSSSAYTIDLAYVAIVDSIGDVVGMLENETNIHYSETTNVASAKTKTELCAMSGSNHAYIINQDGTHITPSCDKCGLVGGTTEKHSYTYNSTNNTYSCVCGYGAAGVAANDSVLDIVRPETMTGRNGQYTDDLGVNVEDGVVYFSITGLNLTKEEYSHGFKLRNDGYIEGARFIVMKVRTSISTHSSWQLHFDGGSGLIGPAANAFTQGEWTTLVIDMSNYGHSFYKPDENGKYPTFTQFLLLPRANAGDYTNSTIDVAYIATVKDIAGVVELVDGDDVMFQTKKDSATKMTAEELAALGQTAE